jgi:hypothetical protein
VEVLQVGREEPLGIGEVQGSQAHVVGNDASCDLGAARDQAARGCTVWVTADDPASGARATYAVSATGVVRPVNSSYARWLTAASYAGTTTAVTEIGDSGSCSGAFGSADASNPPEWSTCRNTLETVSPDGRHVLAGPAYQDGIGSGEVAIYTADGRRVLDLRSTAGSQAFYHSAVWEDPEHVLLTVFQQGHWSVVRLGVDGRAEYAVAPVGGSMDAPPFATAEAPPWQ